jgi:hypothetical protein
MLLAYGQQDANTVMDQLDWFAPAIRSEHETAGMRQHFCIISRQHLSRDLP